MSSVRSLLLSLGVGAALAGCAGTPTGPIGEPPPDNPSLRAVREAPQAFVGRQVRWGGTIAAVDNRPEQTCLEVVARGLADNGRPLDSDRSEGRFLGCVDGFLDPVVYAPGRLVTVRGELVRTETREVGQYPYLYPVVDVRYHRLWEPLPEVPAFEPDPFWYHPWPAFGPYRWGPYPYHPYYWHPRD